VTDVGSPLYLDGKTLVVAAGELGEPFGYALATKTAAAAPVPVRIAQV
jgi:predicted RecA/RadA family phage recombinase